MIAKLSAHLFLLVVLNHQCLAQKADEPKAPFDSIHSLAIVNSKTQARISLDIGRSLKYKLKSSTEYKRARIAETGRNTITFEDKHKARVVLNQADIGAIVFPRSDGRKIAGFIVMVPFALATAGLIANPSQETNASGLPSSGSVFLVSLPFLLTGTILMLPKNVVLEAPWSWKYTSYRVIDTVTPGSTIGILLKGGEKIEKLKIETIDPENIAGTQIARDEKNHFVYTKRTIAIADIDTISK